METQQTKKTEFTLGEIMAQQFNVFFENASYVTENQGQIFFKDKENAKDKIDEIDHDYYSKLDLRSTFEMGWRTGTSALSQKIENQNTQLNIASQNFEMVAKEFSKAMNILLAFPQDAFEEGEVREFVEVYRKQKESIDAAQEAKNGQPTREQ